MQRHLGGAGSRAPRVGTNPSVATWSGSSRHCCAAEWGDTEDDLIPITEAEANQIVACISDARAE